ncbi:MAG TPA: TraB/GumN family protein [Sphingobium sp.]|uniref:TraB/GumN family protein n=1 Tax=Sphingobium sp. TaxID=1912891 RepID=UPI002ED477D1
MPILMRLITSIFSILLLTSPGFAPIGARSVRTGVEAKPALWMVKDSDTTIYLFGTIHVLKPDVRWFHGPVKTAFDKSDTLVLEVVTSDKQAVARATARLAIDPDGPPLSQKLDPALRARYLKTLGDVGLSREQMEPFYPWFAAVSLSMAPLQKLGYSPDAGVEDVLKTAAGTSGKQVVALETVEGQLGFFAGLPEKTQIAFLSSTIDDVAKVKTEIARMVSEWAAGRPEVLADEMNDSLKDMPEVANALLYQRNRNWAEWVAKRMKQPGTVFLAVGAGHLAGKGSLLEDLKARGFTIKRVE